MLRLVGRVLLGDLGRVRVARVVAPLLGCKEMSVKVGHRATRTMGGKK
jgi:hypothetical protein